MDAATKRFLEIYKHTTGQMLSEARHRDTIALGSDIFNLLQVEREGLIPDTGVPPELAGKRVSFAFASSKYAKHWIGASLSLPALALLTRIVQTRADKDARGLVLSVCAGTSRTKKSVYQVGGMMLDADGYPTRDLVKPSHFVIAYATASDGKSEERLSRAAYAAGALKFKLAPVPTAESVLALKGKEKPGSERAYRSLRISIEGDDIVLRFAPQERTRYAVVFDRPLEGDLLQALIDAPKGFEKFGRALEKEVLGVDGTDVKCFEPVRVGYLPTTEASEEPANFYHELMGPPVLFDPVPLAERIVAENPARKRQIHDAEIREDDPIPPHLRDSLEGVMLASIIAEGYPELVRSENNLTPLVLHRCPFADHHSTNPGASDGSAFVFDASEANRYPVVRCHHTSCKGRLTEDFVAEMIAAGDLDAAHVFEESNNRLRYEDDGAENYLDNAAKLRQMMEAKPPAAAMDAINEAIDAPVEDGGFDAPPVTIDDLTPESTAEQIASALETLARSKPNPLVLDSKLDDIVRRLDRSIRDFKPVVKKQYKAIVATLSKSEKAPITISGDRLNLIDHALLFEMNGETPDQTRERARKHIEVQNRKGTPVVYKRGVHPVRLRRDTKSGLKVETLNATTFAAEVERWTVWGETKYGAMKTTGCPSDIAEKLRTDPALDVPTLTDIRNAPFYTAEGQIVASPGYHAPSGVYYDPEGLDVGEIPDVPTDDAVRAAAALVQKPYSEFPFNDGPRDPQGKASRANIIGRDVTAFVREMVDCVPMYLLDKTSHGAGGTLLANVGSIIATGKKAAVDTVKKDSYGWQQAFHSHALAGTSRILIDNVPKGYVIDDTDIAAYGTAARLEGRILGKSEVGGGDVRWILEWTGVNLGFSQENARRSIMVRIDPAMSSPGEREFDIPDLEAWTLENRSDLVRAHLILVQNWIAKGRPSWSGKALASFERWSQTVGGILDAAGIKGFNGNRHLLEGKDSEAMRDFVQMWFDKFGTAPVRPGKVDFDFDADSDAVDNLAKLYVAAGEETYLGVSRKSRDIETLGARLGNKLTEVSGGAFRVETDKYKAHVVSHDYRIVKCIRDNQGSAYQLERVAGTLRIWCRLPIVCSLEQVAEEYAHLEAIRSDSL